VQILTFHTVCSRNLHVLVLLSVSKVDNKCNSLRLVLIVNEIEQKSNRLQRNCVVLSSMYSTIKEYMPGVSLKREIPTPSRILGHSPTPHPWFQNIYWYSAKKAIVPGYNRQSPTTRKSSQEMKCMHDQVKASVYWFNSCHRLQKTVQCIKWPSSESCRLDPFRFLAGQCERP